MRNPIYQIGAPENAAETEPKRIPTQEELLSPESQQLLKQGIDLAKYKVAFKEAMQAIRVTDALAGEHTMVNIHWSVHPALKNWLRAEYKDQRISPWPWGNWWEIRLTRFNRETKQSETEIRRLVIK